MATRQPTRKTPSRTRVGRKTAGSAKAATTRTAARRPSTSASAGRAAAAKAPAERGSLAAARSTKSASSRSAGSRSRKPPVTRGGAAVAPDALALLQRDHDTVDQMFRKYERLKDGDERKPALRAQIIEELTVHAQVEEELFYPALRSLFEAGEKDKAVELIDEADVEHETLKWLIEQIEGGDAGDEGLTDARVKVLAEYVKHHVQEEEGQIFKAARKVALDLADLGRRMDDRKRQLKGEESAQSEAAGGASMQVAEPAQMSSALPES